MQWYICFKRLICIKLCKELEMPETVDKDERLKVSCTWTSCRKRTSDLGCLSAGGGKAARSQEETATSPFPTLSTQREAAMRLDKYH